MKIRIFLFLLLFSCKGGSDSEPVTVAPTPPVKICSVYPSASSLTNLPATACPSSQVITNGDPLAGCSWHLNNTGQDSFSTPTSSLPAGYDMNMLVSGQTRTGQGVQIAISDTGLEIEHEDLASNILLTKNRNYDLPAPYLGNPCVAPQSSVGGDHGTSVAGIIAAVAGNNLGGRGIAPNAQIAMFNFLNSSQSLGIKINQAWGNDFDIFNQSWGFTPGDGSEVIESSYEDQLRYGVTNGRTGKGSLYVKASGNNFSDSVNSNMDPYNTTPYTIVVAGVNSEGTSASYSQAGSCNLISAPAGEYGTAAPAIITTDLTGCSHGYARVSNTSAALNDFEDGHASNPDCSYTSTFNGTSAATPMVSGAIALMLEANTDLTWRDIRHILITTANPIHAGAVPITDNPVSGFAASPSGHNWEDGTITNGQGHQFHNWYGFGAIDVDAAITAIGSYTLGSLGTYNESVDSNGDWAYRRLGINLNIPDNDANGVTDSVTVSPTESLTIESVQIKVNITHDYTGDIGLELTSPSGTKSILLNINNHFKDAKNITNMVLLSNAFYEESSAGTWTLKVIDGAGGDSGTLDSWELKINGGASGTITF